MSFSWNFFVSLQQNKTINKYDEGFLFLRTYESGVRT